MIDRFAMLAYKTALDRPWAMETGALQTLLAIAARQHDVSPTALEAYRAKTLARAEQAQVRDGVAILRVIGPLFKRANIMTEVSGATSYDILRRDLQTAVDDPAIRAILLDVDSPGGEASGVAELANAIHAASSKKPMRAYVNGMGASGGYWIAAAAGPGNIVVDETAILGSIGVQMALRSREDPKGVTTHKFISSQSPLKNADPATEDCAKQMQGLVDALGRVFVAAVATYRGVPIETVTRDFGRGGIMIGSDAVKAGLADRIGNFEGVLAELSAGRPVPITGVSMSTSFSSSTGNYGGAVAAALAAEKTRISNIHKIGAGFHASEADISAAIDGDITAEAFTLAQAPKAAARRQVESVEAARVAEAAEIDSIVAGTMAFLPPERRRDPATVKYALPGVPVPEAGMDGGDPDEMLASITSFIPAHRRGK